MRLSEGRAASFFSRYVKRAGAFLEQLHFNSGTDRFGAYAGKFNAPWLGPVEIIR